ncbi:MAG: hypothetical protein A3A73_03800 [Omnitrophica bacterium RIFCSPLOWO2_01_FULL_50_24]|nr:MAG: hypothetical protein A3A73_03800 [Omnitrophica bacterium RIFCSPLOWO2_01_FULL_50_24]
MTRQLVRWVIQENEGGITMKGVRKMRLDEHLMTGIFLGVVVGLFYTAQLAPYATFFLIGTIVLVLRYLHAK